MKLSKSKLALAKAINENGGWPERALWAAQDNCIAFFLGGKPEYKSGDGCWYSNSIDGACVGTITCDEKVTNWHQTVLSREEYYQAYPKADADGEWLAYCGRAMPCGVAGKVIDAKLGNGRIIIDLSERFEWDTCGDYAIIAYRPHKPDVKPELCESVMRSIPHSDDIATLGFASNRNEFADGKINTGEFRGITKPTIEQLAQDYRNAKDYAVLLQKEAGDAAVKTEALAVEIRKKILELQELIG